MTRIFTSYFPVDQNKSIDDLTKIASGWAAGSPHNEIKSVDLGGIDKDGFTISTKTDTITTIRFLEEKEEIKTDLWGLRYTNSANQGMYTTEVIGARNNKSFEVSVSISYHALKIGSKVEMIRKPRVINDIIKGLGGNYDGACFTVKAEPHWIDPIDIEFIAEAILNKSDNTLPIVYISRNANNWSPVNPGEIGVLLGGMAHVIVEPSIEFSHQISRLTSKRNAYRGAVGIYWPNGWNHRILPQNPEEMQREIFDKIAEYSLYYILPTHLTFDGLKSLKTVATIERMKREKTVSETELLEIYTSELEEKTKRINELESLLHKLTQRVAQLSAKPAGEILTEPELPEFYPAEFLGIIYDAIQAYQRSIPSDSRRRGIIDEFLKCNNKPDNSIQIVDNLKKIFKSNPQIQEVIRRLVGLGFEVDNSGKHPKISIPGYSLAYTIASTPSDQRGAENTVSGIKNKLL